MPEFDQTLVLVVFYEFLYLLNVCVWLLMTVIRPKHQLCTDGI